MNNRRYVWIALLCLASAWTGWRLGLPDSSAKEQGRMESRSEARHAIPPRPGADRVLRPPSGPRARSAEEFAALKRSLMSRFMESPHAWSDWELREQAAAILATLSTEELREFAESLGQTRLDRFMTFTSDPKAKSALLREILLQWGLRDPVAAVLCEAGHEHGAAGNHVLRAWLARAPGEAEQWLFSGDFPDGYESVRAGLRGVVLEEKAAQDFGAALDLWSGIQGDARDWGIRQFAEFLEKDPSRTADLVAKITAHSSPEEAMTHYRILISDMASRSPHQAAELLETIPVAGEEEKRRLTLSWIEGWARKNPVEAFNHWASLGDESPSPGLMSGFSSWTWRDPDRSLTWVSGIEDGPARRRFEEAAISSLMEARDFGRAATLSKNIPDPEQRLRQLKVVHRGWQERDPGGAEGWLAGLPEEDRAALGGD